MKFVRQMYKKLMSAPGVNEFAWRSAYSGKLAAWMQDYQCDPTFDHPHKLYEFMIALPELQCPINYLEFGVHKGESIKLWVERSTDPQSRFVGFDSFEGLPDDWVEGFGEGHFSAGGVPPEVDDERCSFRAGWFNETLPDFVPSFDFSNRPTVVHLDGDLYGSTTVVLYALASKLKAGDILIFDDFSFPLHVFRAFMDFLSAYPMQYELVAKGNTYTRIAVRIVATTAADK